jgi:hypothetical protein
MKRRGYSLRHRASTIVFMFLVFFSIGHDGEHIKSLGHVRREKKIMSFEGQGSSLVGGE